MRPDPSYLDHLGELATLKNFLGCNFHQDVWVDFETMEEAWNESMNRTDSEELATIIEQMQIVLDRGKQATHDFIAKECDLYLETPEESYQWLIDYMHYCQAALAKKNKPPV